MATAGDRNYLVLAKPNVIMNDIRLRRLAVARSASIDGLDATRDTLKSPPLSRLARP
jgi:hypothetical protein